jgi:membrane-associated phospholipid phosphatase
MLKKWLTTVADAGTRRAAVFCAGLVLGWTGLARADDAEAAAPVAAPKSPSKAPARPAAPGLPTPPDGVPSAQQPSAPSPSDLEAVRRAYHYQSGFPCPYCTTTADSTHPRTGLHWHDHWQKVGLREYLTIPLLGATYLGVKSWPAAEAARWDSPILFDGGARRLLRLHSASGRKTAETVSNILFYAEVIHSVVIDPLLVARGLHQSPSVAWQMSVINAQAYALTLVLNETTKRLGSRKRPFVDACDRDPTGASCASGSRYSSFYSGHAAVTATGAGLICAHHTQLTLYQSNVLDTGTCITAIAGTAVTGAMRIMADNHWASDVLVGHLMGYLSGYLLPTLLYYEEFRTAPHDHAPERPRVLALPIVTDHCLQLSLFGQF